MHDTLVCPRCGSHTASSSRFCSSCGASIPPDALHPPVAAAVARSDRLSDSGAEQLKLLLEEAVGGEYRIHEELGRGGMAVVYRATEVHLSRPVAIKVLPPDLTFARGTTERFQLEARTAAALDHPNIIPIHRISSGGKLFWYAMKYLEGRSLGDVLLDKGLLTLPEATAILEQVANALDYAHQRGVVHRDIKPGNVMLDVNGRVTVTDFGIAKELSGSGLTGSGAILGTPHYMSPEQCRGGQHLTGAADQYSLGVMCYQILTGQLPFEADSAIDVIHKHVSEAPPPIEGLLPSLPRHVINAVNRAMAKKAGDRFPTVTAFVAALKNTPSDATLIVHKRPSPMGSRRHAPSWLPAHRGLRALLVVVAMAGAAMAGIWGYRAMVPDPSERAGGPAAGEGASAVPVAAPVTAVPPADSGAVPADSAAPPAPAPAPVRSARTGGPREPAASPGAAAGRGVLRVAVSNGWANITVAGITVEQRRSWRSDSLAAGSYTVTLARDGFEPVNRTVTVRPGQETLLEVTMKARGAP